jgi:hypothetical protein
MGNRYREGIKRNNIGDNGNFGALALVLSMQSRLSRIVCVTIATIPIGKYQKVDTLSTVMTYPTAWQYDSC